MFSGEHIFFKVVLWLNRNKKPRSNQLPELLDSVLLKATTMRLSNSSVALCKPGRIRSHLYRHPNVHHLSPPGQCSILGHKLCPTESPTCLWPAPCGAAHLQRHNPCSLPCPIPAWASPLRSVPLCPDQEGVLRSGAHRLHTTDPTCYFFLYPTTAALF